MTFYIWLMGLLNEYKIPLSIFVIVLVLYLILILIAGTNPPFYMVQNNDMIHRFNYNSWMDEFALCDGLNCTQEVFLQGYGISKRSFLELPFVDGFKKGDILLITKSRELHQGDVIVMNKDGERVVQRVLEIQNNNILHTKADMAPIINSSDIIKLEENKKDNYVGRVWGKI